MADGTTSVSGSRWRGRDVVRVSVSNRSTDDEDVRRSVVALGARPADPRREAEAHDRQLVNTTTAPQVTVPSTETESRAGASWL